VPAAIASQVGRGLYPFYLKSWALLSSYLPSMI
jgi:hypothetical protein